MIASVGCVGWLCVDAPAERGGSVVYERREPACDSAVQDHPLNLFEDMFCRRSDRASATQLACDAAGCVLTLRRLSPGRLPLMIARPAPFFSGLAGHLVALLTTSLVRRIFACPGGSLTAPLTADCLRALSRAYRGRQTPPGAESAVQDHPLNLFVDMFCRRSDRASATQLACDAAGCVLTLRRLSPGRLLLMIARPAPFFSGLADHLVALLTTSLVRRIFACPGGSLTAPLTAGCLRALSRAYRGRQLLSGG